MLFIAYYLANYDHPWPLLACNHSPTARKGKLWKRGIFKPNEFFVNISLVCTFLGQGINTLKDYLACMNFFPLIFHLPEVF